MNDDRLTDRDVEDVELAQRLEAYAEARLSPSLSATTRMRTQVMAVAHRQAAMARADADRATLVGAAVAARPMRFHPPAWRRPMVALLAAGLTLALAIGTVAAARPGGPFYGTRIWVETLNLPSSPSDRATAQVHRLEERLAEAAAATASGDTNAAEAALSAYDGIVTEAAASTNDDPAADATLNEGVRRNLEVLTILAGRVPLQARDAILHAIERSSSAMDGLRGKPGVGDNPAGNPGNGPANGPTVRPSHSANPHKPTPAPAGATARPADKTPKPHPTPKPHVTPAPNAVPPQPQPTPKAGGKPSTPPGKRSDQPGGGNPH